ncbi:MAG TPA: amidase family protein [Longimicrobiales bacterium]|nr:amidase family protein [Longimicrobiales bacterium]
MRARPGAGRGHRVVGGRAGWWRAASCAWVGMGLLAACADTPDPAPIPVVELTITELHRALDAGETTCRMVVQAHLDRIEAYEDRINAITVVNPRALDVADSLDAVQADGDEQGPLHCVPMLVKDNFDTHDMVTTGGSIALRDNVPPDDAFMVRRIREAGAVVVAKTNMAEWAFSPRESVSSSFDTTRNAYALDRVPAGSSGGTASGVAASFGLIGLGSDTGNSIRGPSSHLALVGIRSGIGRTSRDGVIPLSFDRDIAGPMGRTVEDVARVFGVVAGYDPADPYTEPSRDRPEEDYEADLDASALEGARLGVLTALADPAESDTAVIRLFEAARADLEALGAEVVDVDLDVAAQLERENMFCNRFRYDMWVYLGTLGAGAPFRDVTSVLETGEYHPSVERSLRSDVETPLDVPPGEWDEPCPDYADNPGRQAYRAAVEEAMAEAGVEALIYPSWTSPPAHLDAAREEYRGDNSQRVAPATGLPALSVPMGFTYGNLPAGLQILGPMWSEARLLGLAYAYEQGTRHRRPPDGFPELVQEAPR